MYSLRLATAALLLSTSVSMGKDPELPLNFDAIEQIGANAVSVQGPGDLAAIEVNGGSSPRIVRLIDWDSAAVKTNRYVVRGRVKYDSVVGDAYLEMWNDFGDNEKYFSRSLGDLGPMGKLSGASEWREFELPFFHNGGKTPKRLTLNVVLPGAGKVTVSQPHIVMFSATSKAWWTESQAGLIGAILGTFIGLLGAVMGATASLPKTRWLGVYFCQTGITVGMISLVAGIVAVCLQQGWHVFGPLLLIGCVCLGVFGGNLYGVSRRYRDDELRRLTAIDAI